MHYKKIIKTVGRGNKLSFCTDLKDKLFTNTQIIDSWTNSYKEKVARNQNEVGLRLPQYGALSAIRAHWTVSNSPATIVLPTGTGKTETMFTTIVSERIEKTLIIVPTNLLREQIFEGAKTFGILPKAELVSDDIIFPNVFLYKSKVNNEQINKIHEAFDKANIIVSTPKMISNLPTDILNKLVDTIDVVIFDEAHHLAAEHWSNVKSIFIEKRILQFTATPFRNDGKKIGGEIIFNYGLALAQKSGYFQPIDFFPIQEFNEAISDKEIAKRAIKQLKMDLNKGYEHIVLARAKTKNRAEDLYANIYSKYKKYNPVVIHSGTSESQKKLYMEQIRSGKSKIVVCVDMFGEGIDIPTLKIAAIHDKYKSLPITLQFIGRFARSSGNNLGNAKLITNIAIDNLKESIEELYHQDSDWNQLLNVHSSAAIKKEIDQDNFFNNFKKEHLDKIDLSQLKMKISTRVFKISSPKVFVEGWKHVLNHDRTTSLINENENVYVFIEEIEKQVPWSDQKEIVQYEYDFFVVFHDVKTGLVHINETDAGKGNRLIESMFFKSTLIKGEPIYRTLDGINRLMIGTLGLKQNPSGRISFRMFAGTDIKSGISQAIISGSTKSNLFGYGFRNGEKVSLGCSYKGKVWMRWVEQIDFWKEWCLNIGGMILDETIDTNHILENSLMMEEITEFPNATPYKITLPEQIEISNSYAKQLYIPKEDKLYPFFQFDLRNPKLINGNLQFELWLNARRYLFEQIINEKSFHFKQLDGGELKVRHRNVSEDITDFFKNNPPEISFIDESGHIIVVEENLKIEIKPKGDIEIENFEIISIDWVGMNVDIKTESQGKSRKKHSIQYATIHNIVDQSSDIIFDDDGSGEIADVVGIKIDVENRTIFVHLYHCKFSDGDSPGGRVKDLYEVCGQSEKSIVWNDNSLELVKRMIERENKRQKDYDDTRIEKGDIQTLHMLKQMLTSGFNTEFKISIVQPGVSIKKITSPMKQILFATESHLKDTYAIPLTCYFSE